MSATTTPTRASSATSPRRLFGVLAVAEAVTWTLLLLGMLGKYVLDLGDLGDLGVRIGGGLHGFVFLAYCLVTLLVGVDQRWGPARIVTGWVSAVVPYATIPFERWADRQGLLGPTWRLRAEPADGSVGRVVAWVVRHPVPAALVGIVLVAAVFSGLLALGPPDEWFAA